MIRWSAMLGALEALENGTTAIVDHHESPNAIEGSLDVIAEACAEVGVRALLAYGITDRHGPDGARRGLAENERFIKAGGRGLVGIHAAFTCSDESLRAAAGLAADLGVGVHVHVCEGDRRRRRTAPTGRPHPRRLAAGPLRPPAHGSRAARDDPPQPDVEPEQRRRLRQSGPLQRTRWPSAPTGSAATSSRRSAWPTSCSARSTSPAGRTRPGRGWRPAGTWCPRPAPTRSTWSYDPMDPWQIAFTPGDHAAPDHDRRRGGPRRRQADPGRRRRDPRQGPGAGGPPARPPLTATRRDPMSDRFHPISMEQLTSWVFTELEQKGSLFNVPALGVLRPPPRPPLPAPRVRGGAGDAVRRRGRARTPRWPRTSSPRGWSAPA